LHIWFYKESLTSMESFHSTKGSFDYLNLHTKEKRAYFKKASLKGSLWKFFKRVKGKHTLLEALFDDFD